MAEIYITTKQKLIYLKIFFVTFLVSNKAQANAFTNKGAKAPFEQTAQPMSSDWERLSHHGVYGYHEQGDEVVLVKKRKIVERWLVIASIKIY